MSGGEREELRGERGRLEGEWRLKSKPCALAICFLVISPIFFFFSASGEGSLGVERLGEVAGGDEGGRKPKSKPCALAICFLVISPIFLFSMEGEVGGEVGGGVAEGEGVGVGERRLGEEATGKSKLKPWALAICFLVTSPIFFLFSGEVGGDTGGDVGEVGRFGEVGGEEGEGGKSKLKPWALAICFLVTSPIFFLFED